MRFCYVINGSVFALVEKVVDFLGDLSRDALNAFQIFDARP
jgi:hypothetical protein